MLGPPGAGTIAAHRLQQLRGYLAQIEHVENTIEQIGQNSAKLDRPTSVQMRVSSASAVRYTVVDE